MSKGILSIIIGVSGLAIITSQTNWLVALGVYFVWYGINIEQSYRRDKES